MAHAFLMPTEYLSAPNVVFRNYHTLENWWECGINRPKLWLYTSIIRKYICLSNQTEFSPLHITEKRTSRVLIEPYFLAGSHGSSAIGHCHMHTCVFIWMLRQHWDLAYHLFLQISKGLASPKPLSEFSIASFIFFASSDQISFINLWLNTSHHDTPQRCLKEQFIWHLYSDFTIFMGAALDMWIN